MCELLLLHELTLGKCEYPQIKLSGDDQASEHHQLVIGSTLGKTRAETKRFELLKVFTPYLVSSEAHSTGLCDVSKYGDILQGDWCLLIMATATLVRGLTFDWSKKPTRNSLYIEL